MNRIGPDQLVRLYMLSCEPSGMSYVGATCQDITQRWSEHCSLNFGQGPLHKAIKYYGPVNFDLHLLAHAHGRADGLAVEEALVRQHNTIWPFGYNLTYGPKHPTAAERGYRRLRGPTGQWLYVMTSTTTRPEGDALRVWRLA